MACVCGVGGGGGGDPDTHNAKENWPQHTWVWQVCLYTALGPQSWIFALQFLQKEIGLQQYKKCVCGRAPI